MTPSAQPSVGPARQSLLRRLAGAQEAGLVLVIALMGAALAILGGTKDKPVRVDVPAGAVVRVYDEAGRESELGGLPFPQVAGWSVDGRAYSRAEGYRYDAAEGAVFGVERTNKFLETSNLVLVAKDASFIAVMAVGMTAVIILAGIDLSVGSVYAIAALLGGLALKHWLDEGASLLVVLPVGLGLCCLVGLGCGLANGVMIVGLRVHPFVITLGTMAAFRGLSRVLTGGQSVGEFPDSFTSGFFKAEIAGTYPVPVLVMLVVAAAGVFFLTRTVVGRQVYAIGGNETAAGFAGVPVGRVKIVVYALMGLLAGLSAAMYLGFLGAASPSAGEGYELRVIAATVIGGASLAGGRGSALGAVLGAIIIQLIDNGMVILNIDNSYNQIVMGSAIVVAVVIDQAKTRLSSKR
jgi:ribose transport system permease protein